MQLREKIPLRESLIQNVTFQFFFLRHSRSPRRKRSVTFSHSSDCYCLFFRLYLLVLSQPYVTSFHGKNECKENFDTLLSSCNFFLDLLSVSSFSLVSSSSLKFSSLVSSSSANVTVKLNNKVTKNSAN